MHLLDYDSSPIQSPLHILSSERLPTKDNGPLQTEVPTSAYETHLYLQAEIDHKANQTRAAKITASLLLVVQELGVIALAAGGASGAASALSVGVGVVVAEGAGLVDLGLAEGKRQQRARRVPMRRVQHRWGHRGRGPAVRVLDLGGGGGGGDQPRRLGGNRGRTVTRLFLPPVLITLLRLRHITRQLYQLLSFPPSLSSVRKSSLWVSRKVTN
ncbi:hypothetical protein BHM03_00049686 [Ensete ventricosum]|nr:hypothetical protein BHM03_00049686 [Ensete ventricosum]